MKEKCNLNSESAFIDIGSGLGKPNFHAAQENIKLSIGVELVNIRHQLCMQNLLKVVQSANESINTRGVNFISADITKAKSLHPFSHVYQFDLGFEPELHHYIANMFNRSDSCQYLISYRRPLEIARYGYKVEFLTDISTSMSGSGESHKCYFYKKSENRDLSHSKKASTKKNGKKSKKVVVKSENTDPNPASDSADAEDEDSEFISDLLNVELDTSILVNIEDKEFKSTISCDPLFSEIIELSLDKKKLTEYCQQFVKNYFAEGRPQRSCSKSPQRYADGGNITPPRTPNRTKTIASVKAEWEDESKPVSLPISPSPRSPVRTAAKTPTPRTPPRSNKKDESVLDTEISEKRSKSRGRAIRF